MQSLQRPDPNPHTPRLIAPPNEDILVSGCMSVWTALGFAASGSLIASSIVASVGDPVAALGQPEVIDIGIGIIIIIRLADDFCITRTAITDRGRAYTAPFSSQRGAVHCGGHEYAKGNNRARDSKESCNNVDVILGHGARRIDDVVIYHHQLRFLVDPLYKSLRRPDGVQMKNDQSDEEEDNR